MPARALPTALDCAAVRDSNEAMKFSRPGLVFALAGGLAPVVAGACAATGVQAAGSTGAGGDAVGMTSSSTAGTGGATTSAASGGGGISVDTDGGSGGQSVIDPDAACAATSEKAAIQVLPVDIIWMVDNSSSMAPAVQAITDGLNAFAQIVDGKQLDYKVIMLSVRGKGVVQIGGSPRYAVCIPPPLAGDDQCGNGARFFHSSIDIKSTQPLEQLLGTLAQTDGYKAGQTRGGEPWISELRANATKTIVIATDDNSRLSATQFETFAGGTNPFTASLTLPPGLLDPSWNGLFNGYIFSALYGWGDSADPSVSCGYPNGTFPPSPGPTYTVLVGKTGGVRAKICDGAAAWQPFFQAVAQSVVKAAKLSCTLDVPAPSMGTVEPDKVNVALHTMSGDTYLPRVNGAAQCAGAAAWYYDDPQAPKKVILCPAGCDQAQQEVGVDKDGSIQVFFGCATILK